MSDDLPRIAIAAFVGVCVLASVVFVLLMIIAARFQRKAADRLAEGRKLQLALAEQLEQATTRSDEAIKLQREANDLLRQILDKLAETR